MPLGSFRLSLGKTDPIYSLLDELTIQYSSWHKRITGLVLKYRDAQSTCMCSDERKCAVMKGCFAVTNRKEIKAMSIYWYEELKVRCITGKKGHL